MAMHRKTYILFVCKDNTLLSQMAEAMVKLYRDDEICAFSAGVVMGSKVSPLANQLMEKLGYTDMKQHTTKSVKDIPDFNYDFVITIGLPEYISHVSADKRLEWRFPEAELLDEADMIRLRDKLLNKVLNLVISVAV
jgi:protein-tyrosine-phosphatase